ncbi:MAG: Glycine cleavage system H protein [Chlamydiae bacterium]|nr:Glycine cleavage system H protein [Chlamydiota bacterium]
MKFTETHEWIEVENGIGTVGVTDYAQGELGDIVYVELPKVGKAVNAGEEAAVLESTKAAADTYTPVSGKIVEVNTALGNTPELINGSPEKEGWIYKIELSNPQELDSLMDAEKYSQLN